MEDEIDLRQYVDVLVRRWRLIASLTLLATIVATLAHLRTILISPLTYTATASVVLVRTKTDVVFDPKIKTTIVDSTAADAWRISLLNLVPNGAIAHQVITQLGDQLQPGERNPISLIGKVKSELAQKSDLIQIKVKDIDPDKAALIANAWGREYERYINSILGGSPAEYSSSVQSEFKRAQQEYEQTQTAVETFIAKNQIDELNRLIEEKQQIITVLNNGKQIAFTTVVSEEVKARVQVIVAYLSAQSDNKLLTFQKEQEGRRKLLSARLDAQNNARLAVFSQQVQANLQTLANYYDTRFRIRRLIDDAKNMREQVRAGGDAAATSNGFALLLLKSQAFSLSAPLPGQLQVQVGTPSNVGASAAAQIADLNALISALEKWYTELEAAIADLSYRLLSGEGYSLSSSTTPISASSPMSDTLSLAIAQDYPQLFALGDLTKLAETIPTDNPLAAASVEKAKELLQLKGMESLPGYAAASEPLTQAIDKLQKEIRALQAELEQQQSTRQKLIQARELAWETYTTLARKQAEVDISIAVASSEVRFAAPAISPAAPDPRGGKSSTILMAGAAGLFLGIVAAFGVEYLGGSAAPRPSPEKSAPLWNRALRWVMAEGPGLPQRASSEAKRDTSLNRV